MCHLWADSLDELLTMVDKIGVQRKWIQGHPELSHGKHRNASWVHFDISMTMKARAISHGAILTDKFGPVEHIARLCGDVDKLNMVAWNRLRWANLDNVSEADKTAYEEMMNVAAEQ